MVWYGCPVCPLWTALLSHQSPVVSRVSTVGQNCRLLSRPPDHRPHWAAPPSHDWSMQWPLIGFYSRLDLLQCSAARQIWLQELLVVCGVYLSFYFCRKNSLWNWVWRRNKYGPIPGHESSKSKWRICNIWRKYLKSCNFWLCRKKCSGAKFAAAKFVAAFHIPGQPGSRPRKHLLCCTLINGQVSDKKFQ